MSLSDRDVPLFAYVVAVVAGLFLLGAAFLLSGLLADVFAVTGEREFQRIYPAASVIVYAALGAAFGLAWPEPTWRWGVWLSAAPVCVVSLLASDAAAFLVLAATTALPAGAGAYAAGRLHLKYAGVGRPG